MIKKLLLLTFAFIALTSYSQESYYSDVNLQLTGTDLKDALATKIIATHTNMLNYTPGVWEASKITDKDTDATKVVLIYGWENGSDSDITNDRTRSNTLQDRGNGQTFVWNREHVFSKSLANPSLVTNNPGAGTDAHNLRPADKSRNSERNNYKFGSGTGNSGRSNITYNGPDGPNTRGWFPGEEWKGDVSRIIMYMYLRYGTQCLPTNVGIGSKEFTPDEMIDLFLIWNKEDPVSEFEKARNTYHENTSNTYAQGNRNPFIDNPYLATRIWGGEPAQDTWGIYTSSDTEAPTVPTNVTLSNITLTSIDVSWNASTDNEAVVGYNVLVDGTLTQQTTTTSATITGLNTNTSYNISIEARDLINKSEQSTIVIGKTLEDNQAPTVPVNVLVSSITDSSFKVDWNASTDNNEVASYDVFIDNFFKANVTTTTYTVNNLNISTTYSVAVLAKDVDGNSSAKSTSVNATTTDGSSGGTASELFFSEYVEGNGGTNKALEIVNLTGATVSLSGYVVKLERNGASVWTTPLALDSGTTKSIVPGDVFVIGNGDNSDTTLQPNSNSNTGGQVDLVQLSNEATVFGQPVNFNGNDAVALFKDDVLIDIIGIFGDDSNFARNVTLRRKTSVTAPTSTYDSNEWESFPENTFNGIGVYDGVLSNENAILNKIKIYPNPITGNKLFIDTPESVKVTIYDILGKLIKKQELSSKNDFVNVKDLNAGIYLMKIISGSKSISKKIIKK